MAKKNAGVINEMKLLQCCNMDVFFDLTEEIVTMDVKTIMATIVEIAVMSVMAVLVIIAAT